MGRRVGVYACACSMEGLTLPPQLTVALTPRRSHSLKLDDRPLLPGARAAVRLAVTAISMRLQLHIWLRAGPSCWCAPDPAPAAARLSARRVSRCQAPLAGSRVAECTGVVAAMMAQLLSTLRPCKGAGAWPVRICHELPAQAAAASSTA